MAEKLPCGIVRIELPGWFPVGAGARPTNVYLLPGDQPTLVGSGHPAAIRNLTDALRTAGTDASQIHRILCGSWSVDCLGNTSAFPRADVFVGSLDFLAPRHLDECYDTRRARFTDTAAHVIEARCAWSLDELDGYVAARFPRLTNHLDFVPLRAGQFVRATDLELEVVAAPGPHEAHVMFFEPTERVLFCGDFPISGLTTLDRVDDYLVSLERAMELQPKWLLPTHGTPSERAGWILKRMLRFGNNFLGAVANALGEGKTALEFVDADLGHEPDHPVEYLEALEERRPFLEELAAERLIGAEGAGLSRRYVPR